MKSGRSSRSLRSVFKNVSKNRQQDENIPQTNSSQQHLNSISETSANGGEESVDVAFSNPHVSPLYNEFKHKEISRNPSSQASQVIDNHDYDSESLPGIVAGVAKAAPQGEHENFTSTVGGASQQDEIIESMNEHNARQLHAQIQKLEVQLENSRKTGEGKRQIAEDARRHWEDEYKRCNDEILDLKRELEAMKTDQREKVASLKAGHTQDLLNQNTEHRDGIAKIIEEFAQSRKLYDESVQQLRVEHRAELEASDTRAKIYHRKTVENLIKEHEDTVRQREALHDSTKTNLERGHREREGELMTQRDLWKSKHAKEVQTTKEMLQQQKSRHEAEREDERSQTEAKHKQQVAGIKIQHEATLATSAASYEQRIVGLQRKLEAEQRSLARNIKQLQEDLQRARDDSERVKIELQAKISKERKSYEKEVAAQQKASEEAAAARQRLHEDFVASQTLLHEEELHRSIEAHQTELASQEKQYTNLLANADIRHDGRKQELLVLQDRLQKRDNHVALTDSEILEGRNDDNGDVDVHGMATLIAEVKKFAAWNWRDERNIWPQDIMFALAGDKQKRLRKLILGDMIWTVLFHAVFCTPFRLLGDIGKKLEHDWSRNFGEGIDETADGEYIWPRATLDSEKWRYDTCQDALRSLTKPTTEFSDHGRLKKSFFNNRKVIRKQLFESIGRLVELDKEQQAELDIFILNTVRTWLCFGTQRYRLQLFVTGSADLDQETKMDLVQKGDLLFTVAPRLRRIGNSRGTELEEVCTVSGCAGSQESART